MPLSRWNESVLRYHFCRFIATADLDDVEQVEQFVECRRIDLVLKQGSNLAFIEFKFFLHHRRFDPYDGNVGGFKGGPGPKNLEEFQKCVNQLHDHRAHPSLLKYVVLVYADPTDGSRSRLRYANQYEDYHHPRDNVLIRLIESAGPIETKEGIVLARLYQLGDVKS
jgi:hypothetical protein